MKRTATAVMMTAALLIGGGLVTSNPLEASAAKATTVQKKVTSYQTTANLNLRTGMSTKTKVLVTIPKGKAISYISKSGSWLKVQYGKKTGYVSSQYVKTTTKTISSNVAVKVPVVKDVVLKTASKTYATTSNLNLRTSNSATATKITTIPKGKNVSYLATAGSWTKVKYGVKTGYVSTQYLKAVKPASTPKPVAPTPKPVTPVKPATPTAPQPAGGQEVLGVFYTTDSLNMRTGSGVQHAVITAIPKGKEVEHVATDGTWFKVQYGTKTGWVSSLYLSKAPVNTNQPTNPIQWLEDEAVSRTNTLSAQMKISGVRDPFITPTQGRLSSPYGIRTNPTAAGYEFHTGIDLANPSGTPIVATAYAMVDRVVHGTTGYGKYIVLRHDMNGMTFYSLYGHLSRIDVQPGQRVNKGQQIGAMGSTGRSTGPHLHFEIQNGSRQNVNPTTMLNF